MPIINPSSSTGWTYLALTNINSGSSVNVSGIPATVNEIEIIGADISITGTSALQLQIGDSGGIETSGYTGSVTRFDNSGSVQTVNSTSFIISPLSVASTPIDVNIKLSKKTGNIWQVNSSTEPNSSTTNLAAKCLGDKTLSDVLTQVTLLTSDAFNGSGNFVLRYRN